jgi:moderate conductance mechanosensitive channel
MKTNTTDFWPQVGAHLAAGGWKLAMVLSIVIGALLLAWILRIVIRRVVRQIVNGVKKTQKVDDTRALVSSPLAAVRVVQRTRTLGTVLSNIVNVVIGIIALVIIFNLLAPGVIGSLALLTAAIGAGLGFGAQNIVKDVFNGLFMVMEDQLGVGDVVDLGLATGMVEVVGIRVTQVRDVNGVLWFVRNGEIVRVGNTSQGWSRVIIDLAVPYDVDIDAVEDAIIDTATGLASTPKWRSRVLEKPELWGLESISADAIVIRVVMKTTAASKDDVARELRMRLKRATDEMGIQLPSLNAVVLSGFDGAASITGARPPRTKPVPVVEAKPQAKRPTRRALAKSNAEEKGKAQADSQVQAHTQDDPRSVSIIDPEKPASVKKPPASPSSDDGE